MDLKEAEILGDQINKHWCYRAKAIALKQSPGGWMPSEILNIGAGSVFFAPTVRGRWRETRPLMHFNRIFHASLFATLGKTSCLVTLSAIVKIQRQRQERYSAYFVLLW